MLDRLNEATRQVKQEPKQDLPAEITLATDSASQKPVPRTRSLIDQQALQARMDEMKSDSQRDAGYSRRWFTLARRAAVLAECQSVPYPQDADLALDALGAGFPHFAPVVEEVRN